MAPKLVGTWELERYVLDELPPRRLKEIRVLIDQHTELREEIERLKQSNEAILERYPPEKIVPQILKRARPHAQARRRLLYIAPALASALFLIFVLFRPDRPAELTTRPKGEDVLDMSKTQILIYRKNDRDAERLKTGDSVKPGDLLQIAYIAAQQKYGTIFSIDGSGRVTLHFPDDESSSTRLEPGRLVTILSSYELDDASGFEQFFFITSGGEISARDILDKARAQAENLLSVQKDRLDLPSSLGQYSIFLKKDNGHD